MYFRSKKKRRDSVKTKTKIQGKKTNELSKQNSIKSNSSARIRTERAVLLESIIHNQDDIKNLPAEELLELGMNYLNQAIKSWETAVDSIESAAYMQSRTLALPVSLLNNQFYISLK